MLAIYPALGQCAGLSQVYRDISQCEVYSNVELFQVLQPGQLRDRDTANSVVFPGLVRQLLSGQQGCLPLLGGGECLSGPAQPAGGVPWPVEIWLAGT